MIEKLILSAKNPPNPIERARIKNVILQYFKKAKGAQGLGHSSGFLIKIVSFKAKILHKVSKIPNPPIIKKINCQL